MTCAGVFVRHARINADIILRWRWRTTAMNEDLRMSPAEHPQSTRNKHNPSLSEWQKGWPDEAWSSVHGSKRSPTLYYHTQQGRRSSQKNQSQDVENHPLKAQTWTFLINRWLLLSENSRPTVKLWKLCVPSNFFAVSRNSSSGSGGNRNSRFLDRSSSREDVAPTAPQNGCTGGVSPVGNEVW